MVLFVYEHINVKEILTALGLVSNQ